MLIEPGNHPFCDNIRYLKKRYCLSRRSFARLLHVSVSAIRDWEMEKGPAVLAYSTCMRICTTFEINAVQLPEEHLDR